MRFTLVEFLVVMAVVVILALAALPALERAQLKAQRAELYVNVDALVVDMQGQVERQTSGAWGTDWHPASYVSSEPQAFAPNDPDWQRVTWRPDGPVRCAYRIQDWNNGEGMIAEGTCDLDHNQIRPYLYGLVFPGGGEPWWSGACAFGQGASWQEQGVGTMPSGHPCY